LVVAAAAGAAVAAPTVNGKDFTSEYGTALWSQTLGTQFGNSTDPGQANSNGSEIDNVFATIVGNFLYVGVGGNLETNFNKLNIALDFRSGGQNTLNGLPNLGNLNGLTLDAGFDADVVLSYTNGNPPQSGTGSGGFEHYLDGANVGGGGGFLGGGPASAGSALLASLDGATTLFASDHSNVGGVNSLGNPNDSDPALVSTGVEFAINLGALGWDGVSAIKIAGWINGGGNDFLSNQVIGGLPSGFGNLGGPGGVNFQNIAGDQFVVIPTPGALALVGLGGLIAARRRTR
jgi:hypothetical protein